MQSITPESIVVWTGIVLAFWYLLAAIYNRRRGLGIYYWMRNGFDQLGEEISSRWIGSSGSGAQIHIHKATPPLKHVDLIYLLASRELLPLFLVDLLRGKRDRLIVKAELRSQPIGEVEVVPARSGLARQLRAESKDPWQVADMPHERVIGWRGRQADAMRAAVGPFIEKYGMRLHHLSWSRKAPHLIITLSLAGLYQKGGSATDLYADVTAIASAVEQTEQAQ